MRLANLFVSPLAHVEFPVEAACPDELVVASLLDNVAVLHDQNYVCVFDGR